MYLKHIYLSGGAYEDLQYLCGRIRGVVDVTAGQIILESESDDGGQEMRFGVSIRYNPKYLDLSTLFDTIYAVVNPYAQTKEGEMPKGIYYNSLEDEPQIEYYINFLNSRGREPLVSSACITVNDPMPQERGVRRCQIEVGRIHRFSPLEEDAQYRDATPPAKSSIDYAGLFAAGIIERPA
ncbi:hypothetical protein [Selenomonas sp. TAMA-11512]|uniref:hypothetical protein n=1 Tax=Selenomonas sp. TAMA-11512 TaxID=3095337 RepID=UPI0030D22021